MGLLFAVVGIFQWATHSVLWNSKVIADNAFGSFYRVNSLFWDPSIYGRFLAVAILVALAVVVFGPWERYVRAVCAGIVVVWAGLLVSFSQSSFAALIGGVLVVSLLAWRRGHLAAAAIATVLLVALGSAYVEPRPEGLRLAAAEGELNRATRGRFDLVKNGLGIAFDHPLVGVGVGGFTKAYRERVHVPRRVKTPASHNTPVTVAAENGIVGLGLLVWLLVAAFMVPFARSPVGSPAVRVTGIAAGLGLTAIVVHSLFYNALFEDPLTWGFLALAALAARDKESSRQESKEIV